MNVILFITIIISTLGWPNGHPDVSQQTEMIQKVNDIRTSGCKCGKRFMKPVQKVAWNDTLYLSALSHANEMDEYHFFAHFSKDGLNIGQRIEKVGYKWFAVGENLGEGQVNFDEVLQQWLKSYTHCTMLMNPNMEEMAVAKVGKFWVQHFGTQHPIKRKE